MSTTNSPTWLQESRAKAAKDYGVLPIPTRKNELFKYTYVGGLNWQDIDAHLAQKKNFRATASEKLPSILENLPELQSVNVTVFDPDRLAELAKIGVEIVPLVDANSPAAIETFKGAFDSIARDYADDKFLSFTSASFVGGYLLKVKKGADIKLPLHILNGDSWGTDANFAYRNLLHIEAGAKCTILDEFRSVETPAENLLRTGLVEILVDENACLDIVTIVDDSEFANHFRRTLVRQAKSSTVRATTVYMGGRKTQDRWEIHLDGEGADFLAKGAARLANESSLDFVGDVHHLGSHTRSGIDFWSVADDKAKVIFNGLIDVDTAALHTDAFQKNHGLLLATGATIHSMPKLIIATDEVACAHGASIARLSDEQLFYLQSRGIDPDAAKKMVVDGFTEPALKQIDDKNIRISIRNAIVGGGADE